VIYGYNQEGNVDKVEVLVFVRGMQPRHSSLGKARTFLRDDTLVLDLALLLEHSISGGVFVAFHIILHRSFVHRLSCR
jgi:hypothetical protein